MVFRKRSKGSPEYFIWHKFWGQQPLEHQSFDQGVQNADQLVSRISS